MANRKQKIGKWGEGLAAAFLVKKGYLILDQNLYTSYGEIDIIALQVIDSEKYLVFVEVKTRTSLEFGNPEDSITWQKKEHLISSIETYLQNHPDLELPWRIDVIAIQKLRAMDPPNIQHFEGVFS
ncbi:MAG: YraN family protein [Anaerolineales bacterium]|nr:YraN family protein [Anaerolineales bacterium]